MTEIRPPAIATWLLKHLARANDALIGDLLEEHRRRGSALWYWKQVAMAVALGPTRTAVAVVAVLALYVAGSQLSIPGANAGTVTLIAARAAGTPFGLLSILVGGQLSGVTIFALGIMPYVTAALLVQVVALFWRAVGGHVARRRHFPVVACTWVVAIVLCVTQAVGLALFLERTSAINPGLSLVANPGWVFRITTALMLTAGTVGLMRLSDEISRRGMGNGMLLVFSAGVLAGLSTVALPLLRGQADPVALLGYLAVNATIAGVVSYGYRAEPGQLRERRGRRERIHTEERSNGDSFSQEILAPFLRCSV